MDNLKSLSEPLRITDSGKYELYDYKSLSEIAITGAMLLAPHFETSLHTTVKIIEKESQREFDRFMLLAFVNPSTPEEDKIKINGKFFNPKKHYLRIEPKNGRDEIHFMLYFSTTTK